MKSAQKYIALTAVAVASLCGCASTPPQAAAANDSKEEVVRVHCDQEAPTGSSIMVRRCRTQQQAEAARRDAAETLENVTRSPLTP